jgi:hypothetical protein
MVINALVSMVLLTYKTGKKQVSLRFLGNVLKLRNKLC